MTRHCFCDIDSNVTEDVINRELFKIYEWLGPNKLGLSVSKTKFMIVHTRNTSVRYRSLLINGKLIERVTQFIFRVRFYRQECLGICISITFH